MNVNPGHRYNELTNSEFLHKLGVLVKGKVPLDDYWFLEQRIYLWKQ